MAQRQPLTEERNPSSLGLDRRSIKEILQIMNLEDKKVAEAVGQELDQIARAVQAFIKSYKRGGRIFYVGTGTSGRLGVLDAVECPPTFGVAPERIQGLLAGGEQAFSRAVESEEDDRAAGERLVEERGMTEKDLVVGISASGETPFVIGCIAAAKSKGIKTVGITTNPDSSLVRLVDIPIAPVVGPEVIAGSTRLKAGTAQKMVLNMLSTAAMVKLGKVYDNLMIDMRATNRKLRRRAEEILKALTGEDPRKIREALAEADYEVKPALVMLKAGISYEEARRLLEKHEGFVRRVLKELKLEG